MIRYSTFLICFAAFTSPSAGELASDSASDGLVDVGFSKLHDIATQCVDQEIMTGQDWIGSALKKYDQYCTDTQASKFEAKLMDYNECSGTNFEAFIETFWDAMMGMSMTCASYFYKHGTEILMDFMTGSLSQLPFRDHMSPECVDSLLGNNAFGDFVREHSIHPKKDAECLVKLGRQVPDCTLRRWPVSIPGSILKAYSCMNNKMQEMDMCDTEVEALKCLPSVTDIKKSKSGDMCQKWAETCTIDKLNAGKYPSVIMILPPPLSAQPFPDICDEVDSSHDVSARLKAYQEACLSVEDRKIWTQGTSGVATVPMTETVKKLKSAQEKAEQTPKDEKSSSSSGFMLFFFGLVVGVGGTALVVKKKSSGNEWQPAGFGSFA